MDYAVMPSVGIEVIFSLENGNAISIKVGQLQNDTSSQAMVESKTDSTSRKDGTRGDFGEQGDKKSLEVLDKIEIDKGVSESLEEYFADFFEIVKKNEEAVHSPKKLDFFMMKRFLNTAYHNLKQIDRSISEGKFKEIEEELKFLYKIYGSFVRITSLPPEVAYEMIFLEQQSGYKEAQIRIKSLKGKLEHARRIERSLKNELEHKESLLREGGLNHEKVELLESQLKPIRREYADAVFETGRAREHIMIISKAIDRFKREYYEEFMRLFETID